MSLGTLGSLFLFWYVVASGQSIWDRIPQAIVSLSLAFWAQAIARHFFSFGENSIRKGWEKFHPNNWVGSDLVFMLPNGNAPDATWLLNKRLWARRERRDQRHRELNTSEFALYVQATGRQQGSQIWLARNGFPIESQDGIGAGWMQNISLVDDGPYDSRYLLNYSRHGVTEQIEIAQLLEIVTEHPEALTATSLAPYLQTTSWPKSLDTSRYRDLALNNEGRLAKAITFIAKTDRLKNTKEGLHLLTQLKIDLASAEQERKAI